MFSKLTFTGLDELEHLWESSPRNTFSIISSASTTGLFSSWFGTEMTSSSLKLTSFSCPTIPSPPMATDTILMSLLRRFLLISCRLLLLVSDCTSVTTTRIFLAFGRVGVLVKSLCASVRAFSRFTGPSRFGRASTDLLRLALSGNLVPKLKLVVGTRP